MMQVSSERGRASKPKEKRTVEIRKATAPHPMDATPDAPKAPAKPKATLSASKVNRSAKHAKADLVPAHRNAKGDRLRCMVMLNGRTQCGNPQRHPVGKGWICSNHNRARLAGITLQVRGKATIVWIAPHTPVAQA